MATECSPTECAPHDERHNGMQHPRDADFRSTDFRSTDDCNDESRRRVVNNFKRRCQGARHRITHQSICVMCGLQPHRRAMKLKAHLRKVMRERIRAARPREEDTSDGGGRTDARRLDMCAASERLQLSCVCRTGEAALMPRCGREERRKNNNWKTSRSSCCMQSGLRCWSKTGQGPANGRANRSNTPAKIRMWKTANALCPKGA